MREREREREREENEIQFNRRHIFENDIQKRKGRMKRCDNFPTKGFGSSSSRQERETMKKEKRLITAINTIGLQNEKERRERCHQAKDATVIEPDGESGFFF